MSVAKPLPHDAAALQEYVRAAFWGTLPSILFFLTTFLGLIKGLSPMAAVGLGFAVWLAGAACHQWLLR